MVLIYQQSKKKKQMNKLYCSMFICLPLTFLPASVLPAIFQVPAFCFATVMRYIITFVVLFFRVTAVEIIFVLRQWPVTWHRFVLSGILTSASFHK
jgi:hypothetical protein